MCVLECVYVCARAHTHVCVCVCVYIQKDGVTRGRRSIEGSCHVLQCITVYCKSLQRVAVCCSVLQWHAWHMCTVACIWMWHTVWHPKIKHQHSYVRRCTHVCKVRSTDRAKGKAHTHTHTWAWHTHKYTHTHTHTQTSNAHTHTHTNTSTYTYTYTYN